MTDEKPKTERQLLKEQKREAVKEIQAQLDAKHPGMFRVSVVRNQIKIAKIVR